MKRFPLILSIGLFVLIVAVIILVLLKPVGQKFAHIGPGICLDHVVADLNGNGKLDPGEQYIDDVAGLQIQISDPNGPNSGTYAFYDCHFDGTTVQRTIHLHFLIPDGYVATSPVDYNVTAFAEPGFTDYPPTIPALFIRLGSAASATP